MEQREKETWGEGLMDGQGREIEPGDHVAVLFRETGEQAEVTELIRDRCEKKRWYLLYIARFPEKNPAIFETMHLAQRGKAHASSRAMTPSSTAPLQRLRVHAHSSGKRQKKRSQAAIHRSVLSGKSRRSSRTGRARVS